MNSDQEEFLETWKGIFEDVDEDEPYGIQLVTYGEPMHIWGMDPRDVGGSYADTDGGTVIHNIFGYDAVAADGIGDASYVMAVISLVELHELSHWAVEEEVPDDHSSWNRTLIKEVDYAMDDLIDVMPVDPDIADQLHGE